MEARKEDSTDGSSIDEGVSDIFGNVHAGKGFYINKDVYDGLYDYQRKGLLWFWDLHQKEKGGILGDDMGLGKTIQVIAFLRGLVETRHLTNLKVLIVLPVTLLQNWEREFSLWAPSMRVCKHREQDREERKRVLKQVQSVGGVVLTSYGLVRTGWHELSHDEEQETFVWDYMICDEGHRIKNPAAQTTKAAHAIRAKHRFILTGTPIQNNLEEFWALFSFAEASILGKRQTFKREYEQPIMKARKKEATPHTKAMGNALSESLRKLTEPYFLHRRKADILKKKEEEMGNERMQEDKNVPGTLYDCKFKLQPPLNEATSLAHKNDLVMWISPSKTQISIYHQYVNLDFFKKVMKENDKKCVFVELMILKSLCVHPRLLSKRACRLLGLTMEPRFGEEDDPSEGECAAEDITRVSEEVLLDESGKLEFLFKLLENLREEGHRCLVFSRSLKMLNIIEKILRTRQFRWKRLDGNIPLNEREAIIHDFQDDDSYNVFLLTTQVGGTGLNLTGANRVVIVDPSWNPSTDNQAVDRAYRIGQTRSVIVYRLITCGTIEEKIYRRQVFKESIIKQTMGKAEEDTYRYFTSQELRDLFVLEDTNVSVTQKQLKDLHAWQRRSERELDAHITFLESIVSGISDHDLLFSLDGKTLRAKFWQYDHEVRLAEGQLADDNARGRVEHVMNMDLWEVGSTKNEKRLHLPSFHEWQSLPNQSLNKASRDSKPMQEIWIADDSSSEDDDDGYVPGFTRKSCVKEEKGSNALQQVQVTERRIAIPSILGAVHHAVKNENSHEGCSTRNEKKPRIPTLHERQSLANQRLIGTVKDSQSTNEVWTIDDSSSDEDAGYLSNPPNTSCVKMEGTQKDIHHLNSDRSSDASRTHMEIDNVSSFHGNLGQGNVDGSEESLEIVEWMSSQKENDHVPGNDTGDDNANDDDAHSDSSSIICLEESSVTNIRFGTASYESEGGTFKQEKEEGSPPPKKAIYEDYKFKWLDRR